MSWCVYLTHPEVVIDPAKPVPDWGLSPLGRERAAAAARLPFAKDISKIVSSAETKAIETAQIFAGVHKVPVGIRKDLHENDRSATGFLPPDQFEQAADRFFARPEVSMSGWERAVDAQDRIVAGVRAVLDQTEETCPVLFTGHGAVGTLLMCFLLNVPISRHHDQKRGGCWYRFEKDWLQTRSGDALHWIEV